MTAAILAVDFTDERFFHNFSERTSVITEEKEIFPRNSAFMERARVWNDENEGKDCFLRSSRSGRDGQATLSNTIDSL